MQRDLKIGKAELIDNGRFLIYSITKIFIAASILRLVEQNRLLLDEPVLKWFPEIPGARIITKRHLLNHTSGLPDYGTLSTYHQEIKEHPLKPWTWEAFLTNTLAQDLIGSPGEKFHYSNLGYALLKRLIELATGKDFANSMDGLLLKPLGLNDLTIVTKPGDLRDLVPSRSSSISTGRARLDVRLNYHPGWVAHGVMAATAQDVALFLDKLFNNEVLNVQSLKDMKELTEVKAGHRYFDRPAYGLGLMSARISGRSIYGHTGSGPGFGGVAYYNEESRNSIVLLSNSEDPGFLEMALL